MEALRDPGALDVKREAVVEMMQHAPLSSSSVHLAGAGLVSPPLPPPPPPGPRLEQPPPPPPAAGLPPEPRATRRPASWLKPILIAVAALTTLGIAVVLVALLLPHAELVVDSFDVPTAVVSGDDVPVDVALANEGDAAGEQELTVLVDGEPAASTTVALDAGTQETITITVTGLAPGTYDVALADWEGLSDVVWVMTPPEFEVDTVSVSPSPMDINESDQAAVLVTVANIGEAQGSHGLQLLLDGEVVAERSVDLLDGGATAEESFTVTVDGPGSHEVSVDGVTASFEVYQLERPANGTTIINDIGGGANQLTIRNNFTEDAVIALARPGDDQPALLSVYVRGESSHTVSGIRDGTYVTYFAHGSDWCTYHREFTRGAFYGRFEGNDVYESAGSTYTIFTVEFGVGAGEAVPTEGLTSDAFPGM
jgi:hypothetical protein